MRDLAEQRYSWDVVADQYSALYRSVLRKKPQPKNLVA